MKLSTPFVALSSFAFVAAAAHSGPHRFELARRHPRASVKAGFDKRTDHLSESNDYAYESNAYAADSAWGEDSSSAWEHTSAAAAAEGTSAHESSSAWESSYPGAYGSGSYANAGSYDQCVQMCMQANYETSTWTGTAAEETAKAYDTEKGWESTATYAAAEAKETASVDKEGNLVAGKGQVIVAPKQGDLRFVPFAMNAAPGSSIEFVWGGGPHTVTQSTSQSICNATGEMGAFISGQRNASATFIVNVTTTEPTYYYCAVGMHCKNGMFGVINPTAASESSASFDFWMTNAAANDTELAATWNQTQLVAKGTAAENWGGNWDVNMFEEWARPMAAEQILATRVYYAENPDLLAANSVDASSDASAASGPSVTSIGATSRAAAASGSSSSSTTGAASSTGAPSIASLILVLASVCAFF